MNTEFSVLTDSQYGSTVLSELPAVSTEINTTAVLYMIYCNKLRLTLLLAKGKVQSRTGHNCPERE